MAKTTRISLRILLFLVAIVLWATVSKADTHALAIAFMVGAVAMLLTAFRPVYGAALLVVGFMTLGMSNGVEVLNVWNFSSAVFTAAGVMLLLRRWILPACLIASLPFFALSNASAYFQIPAFVLVFAGLGNIVRLTMSGRRNTGLQPLPHLRDGPLTSVQPRMWTPDTARIGFRSILIMAILFDALAVVGLAMWLGGSKVAGPLLSMICAIIGPTFTFSYWFAGRSRYRVDESGIYARVAFGETAIPWRDVAGIGRMTVGFPFMGVYYPHYTVLSATHQINIYTKMPEADALRAVIEQATGLEWSEYV